MPWSSLLIKQIGTMLRYVTKAEVQIDKLNSTIGNTLMLRTHSTSQAAQWSRPGAQSWHRRQDFLGTTTPFTVIASWDFVNKRLDYPKISFNKTKDMQQHQHKKRSKNIKRVTWGLSKLQFLPRSFGAPHHCTTTVPGIARIHKTDLVASDFWAACAGNIWK